MGKVALEIAVAVAIPVLAFVLNWSVRAKRGYALSAAADFALAIMAFDLVAVAAHDVFEKAVHLDEIKESFVQLFLVLFAATAAAWSTIFLHLEHKMSQGYDFDQRVYSPVPPMGRFWVAGASWLLS